MSVPSKFPLASLREFLVPDQLVQLRTFMAPNIEELDRQINEWVKETKAIIAVPGPLTVLGDAGISVSLTFVPATAGE
jgi:hypothetical protein